MEEIEVSVSLTKLEGDQVVWLQPSYKALPFDMIALEVACYFDRHIKSPAFHVFETDYSDFTFRVEVSLADCWTVCFKKKKNRESLNFKVWGAIYGFDLVSEEESKTWAYPFFFSEITEESFWVHLENFSGKKLRWKG